MVGDYVLYISPEGLTTYFKYEGGHMTAILQRLVEEGSKIVAEGTLLDCLRASVGL